MVLLPPPYTCCLTSYMSYLYVLPVPPEGGAASPQVRVAADFDGWSRLRWTPPVLLPCQWPSLRRPTAPPPRADLNQVAVRQHLLSTSTWSLSGTARRDALCDTGVDTLIPYRQLSVRRVLGILRIIFYYYNTRIKYSGTLSVAIHRLTAID